MVGAEYSRKVAWRLPTPSGSRATRRKPPRRAPRLRPLYECPTIRPEPPRLPKMNFWITSRGGASGWTKVTADGPSSSQGHAKSAPLVKQHSAGARGSTCACPVFTARGDRRRLSALFHVVTLAARHGGRSGADRTGLGVVDLNDAQHAGNKRCVTAVQSC